MTSSGSVFSAGNLGAVFSTSRPTTRDGGAVPAPPNSEPPPIPTGSASAAAVYGREQQQHHSKSRKPSFSRKSSFSRRRGSSSATINTSSHAIVTNADAPPALPDYALSAAVKIVPRDIERPNTSTGNRGPTPNDLDGLRSPASPEQAGRSLSKTATNSSTNMFSLGSTGAGGSSHFQEASLLHANMVEVANKRISTLDYLRKSHEGRIYWFNTYLFDKPDLHRMPYFDHRKLARKATNYLLLGLSLPIASELYATSPVEFLRTLSVLLAEFDTFQQLHSENSSNRPQLKNMFRRQAGKARRSTVSASDAFVDDQTAGATTPVGTGHNVINFAASESDLHPGEEYNFLLTPSLPFDPDYYETFATLCDVLIEAYTKFLAFLHTPKDCSPLVAELFTKVDTRVRKLIVQGVVKEFEEHSRTHSRTEIANVGKVVLGGLM